MNILLFILDVPRCGSERCYNGLRRASAQMRANPANRITVLLMAAAVIAVRAGRKTPNGYCNTECMLKRMLAGTGESR